jgi:hypothetical protein
VNHSGGHLKHILLWAAPQGALTTAAESLNNTSADKASFQFNQDFQDLPKLQPQQPRPFNPKLGGIKF